MRLWSGRCIRLPLQYCRYWHLTLQQQRFVRASCSMGLHGTSSGVMSLLKPALDYWLWNRHGRGCATCFLSLMWPSFPFQRTRKQSSSLQPLWVNSSSISLSGKILCCWTSHSQTLYQFLGWGIEMAYGTVVSDFGALSKVTPLYTLFVSSDVVICQPAKECCIYHQNQGILVIFCSVHTENVLTLQYVKCLGEILRNP